MTVFNILSQNINLEDKKTLLQEINAKKKHKGNQCLYAMQNEVYQNFIKIGCTNEPARRKLDYKTYSPHEYSYDWVIYLENFDCHVAEEIVKIELDAYNIKENGGKEFYKLYNSLESVRDVLDKYGIFYKVEIGDKFKNINKIENSWESQEIVSIKNMNSNHEFLLAELQKADPTLLSQLLSPEAMRAITQNNVAPEDDITNYKFQYILQQFKGISESTLRYLKNQSQSIGFFIDRIQKHIRDIIVLGLIQSGKTREIIQMIYFCIRYLKIPVVVLIQNKTSGFLQLKQRIQQFNRELNKYNIPCQYVKGMRKSDSVKVFDVEKFNNMVYICLSNHKQLKTLQQNLENVNANHKKLKPFALIMDEYDDLIKSRQDEAGKSSKSKIEPYILYLKEKSLINVGVTATLLSVMLSEENITINNIFQLKPGNSYVGFESPRIKVYDISEFIFKHNSKTNIHEKDIVNLVNEMDTRVQYEIQDYCLALINVSDAKKTHNSIFDRLRNDFDSWAHVIFHSGEDNMIRCSLPAKKFSKKNYEEGNISVQVIINKESIRIPQEYFKKWSYDEEDLYFERYTIDFIDMTIQDIITELFKYTDKISVISGRMACRGISFVNADYTRHITDMIYVPSDRSHVTRNVQDMRIYGNFPDDGININLFVDKTVYFEEIQNYIQLQNDLLKSSQGDTSLKDHISRFSFDSKKVPSKKWDRNNLIKGFSFSSQNSWGIPTHYQDLKKTLDYVNDTFPEFEVKIMSIQYKMVLPRNKIFKPPTRMKGNNDSAKYKEFIIAEEENINTFSNRYGISVNFRVEGAKIFYIMSNYKNGWLLHNPISIQENISEEKRKSLDSICYLGEEGNNYIDLVIKNKELHRNPQEFLGSKTILVFWGMGCYHIFRADKDTSYLVDKYSNS